MTSARLPQSVGRQQVRNALQALGLNPDLLMEVTIIRAKVLIRGYGPVPNHPAITASSWGAGANRWTAELDIDDPPTAGDGVAPQ